MPFEVGLAVATARWRPAHQWFLLEARPYRVQQTLSDLGGTDAYIHGDGPRRLLIALTDALVRAAKQPTLAELCRMFQLLSAEATGIRRNYGTLFGARAFRDLVVVAVDFATREGARLAQRPIRDKDREKSRRAMAAMLKMKKIDIGALKKAYAGRSGSAG